MIWGRGSRRNNAEAESLLKGLRVQSSLYGAVLPIVYGTNRIGGNLLWYGDFVPVPHTTHAGKGGLFGGGGKGGSSTTYTYKAAVAIALAQGPIDGVYRVWDTNGALLVVQFQESFVVPGGGGNYTPTHAGNFHKDIGVSEDEAYSFVVNDYGSPGPVTLAGTQNLPMVRVASAPASGEYSVNDTTGVYTFAAADGGKTVRPSYLAKLSPTPLAILVLSLFKGALSQAAWSYLTSAHPTQAIGYTGLAYVASAAMDLGGSGLLPALSYEVRGFLPFGGGVQDANPSAIAVDMLTNPVLGVGLAAGEVDALTQYSAYCRANGLFLSPILDTERSAADWVRELLEATNSEAVWSSGKLKIIPYGDTSVVGNGVTYTPDTTPAYDLTADDLVPDAEGNYVQVIRPTVQDAFNLVSVEFVNRSNHYAPEIVEEKDQGAIEAYGLRKDSTRSFHSITTKDVAVLVANTLLRRLVYIRNRYRFTMTQRHILVDPMDLVTLTEPRHGLLFYPVRVKKIVENENGDLVVDAEDFPWGTAQPSAYEKQDAVPFIPDADADPGSVNAPIIFEERNRQTSQLGHTLMMAVSGASFDWGGATIWASVDGSTYAEIGKVFGKARMGVLSATLASGSDPDTTHTLSVDLAQSGGQLLSGSAADCDAWRTLCYVDGELISYQTATLVSGNQYDLATRLRRGVFGTTIGSHASGTKFARLDDAIFEWEYDPTLIGQTMHFKFTSINARGLREQTLADVADYTFVVPGNQVGYVNIDAPPGDQGLDIIREGATYGRPLGSRLSAGKPLIDFGESIHPNKHMGNMPDDPVTRRHAAIQPGGTGDGFQILTNPDFTGGSLAGYTVYDNNATGNVTIVAEADATAPNSSGYRMKVAVASGGSQPEPGLGGFYRNIPADAGPFAVNTYHKGSTIIWRIRANIPAGYTLEFASNSYGAEGTFTWLTSQAGTGGWFEYVGKQVIGTTGSFSTTGFFYIGTSTTRPMNWYVAVCSAVCVSFPQGFGVPEVDADRRPLTNFASSHLNKNADNIAEAATRKWAGESGADITGAHTANDVAYGGGRAVAQHGADVTSSNTSADTAAVAGLAAGRVPEVLYSDSGVGRIKPVKFADANPGVVTGSQLLAQGTTSDTTGAWIVAATVDFEVPSGISTLKITLQNGSSGSGSSGFGGTPFLGASIHIGSPPATPQVTAGGSVTEVTFTSPVGNKLTVYLKGGAGSYQYVIIQAVQDLTTPIRTGKVT